MKKMTAAVVLLFAVWLGTGASAAETSEDERLWYDKVASAVDGGTSERLSSFGLDPDDPSSVTALSPGSVFAGLKKALSAASSAPLKTAGGVLVLMTVLAAAESLLPDDGSFGGILEAVGSLACVYAVFVGSGGILSESLRAVSLAENFILALVPVFCGLLGLSGEPAGALCFSGFVTAFAEVSGVFFAKAVPAFSAFGFAVAVASAVDPSAGFAGIGRFCQRAATVSAGAVAGVFSALLSARNALASAADSLAVKGLKFAVGSAVPVVGPAVADAMSSVVAGVAVIRSTAGVFAAAVLVITVLPSFLTLFLWRGAVFFLSCAAELLGRSRMKEFLRSLGGLFSVLTAVICFETVVFLITLALIIIR